MKRSTFFAIVIGGTILIVFVIIFFIASNPYERINPVTPPSETQDELPPTSAEEAIDTELLTVQRGSVLGMNVGVDQQRLIYFDQFTNKITVSEFDGTATQELSEVISGVQVAEVSPTKDQVLLLLTDPDSPEIATIIYDLRTQESVRLEDGIIAASWSPDGSQIAYYVAREGSAPALKIVSASGTAPRTVRDNFSLADPIVQWYADDAIAVSLFPEASRASSLVSININDASSFELVPPANALQARFSPDGSHALVSYNDASTNKPTLALLTISSRELSTLSLVTWVNKCTWSGDSALIFCFVPDLLQGGFTYPEDDLAETDFQDKLWVIDAETSSPSLIYDVPDVIKNISEPFYGDGSKRLNFMDRSTNAYFSLDVSDKVLLTGSQTQEEL